MIPLTQEKQLTNSFPFPQFSLAAYKSSSATASNFADIVASNRVYTSSAWTSIDTLVVVITAAVSTFAFFELGNLFAV